MSFIVVGFKELPRKEGDKPTDLITVINVDVATQVAMTMLTESGCKLVQITEAEEKKKR